MNGDAGLRRTWVHWLCLAGALMTAPVLSSSETKPNPIPSNAQANVYGYGWDCSRGFRRTGETCVPVEVPVHGYLDSSGEDWDCDRGYLKAARACAAIEVPANAHADNSSFDPGWRCDRGFRQTGDHCERIVLPAHAFAVDTNHEVLQIIDAETRLPAMRNATTTERTD